MLVLLDGRWQDLAAAEQILDRTYHRDKDGRFSSGGGGGGAADQPLTGDAALAAPPKKLAQMKGDPRAESLWYRTGDNSMETPERVPGSYTMNQQMRQGSVTPKMQARIDDIDSVMAESHLGSPIEVYRGIGGTRFGDKVSPGTEFSDKAFASTTTDFTHAHGFATGSSTGAIMRIRAPEGTPAIRLADAKGTPAGERESEILLDRGLKYRVVADAEHPVYVDSKGKLSTTGGQGSIEYGTQRIIDVEIVP